VTFTARVTSASGKPVGKVIFKDGETVLGTASLSKTTGIATFKTKALSKGDHTISAVYNGEKNFDINETSLPQQVQ
jgi:hypothetical protein